MKILFLLVLVSTQLFALTERQRETRAAIEETSLQYFLNESHPDTGLTRDKAQNFTATLASNRVASLAATGFSLAVIAHAGAHGKMDRAEATQYVVRTLDFTHREVPHYKGWLLHFVDWQTGKRIWESEFSTIDTALFLAGALYASQVLKDQQIHTLTQSIYRRVDFAAALNGKKNLSLSYTAEKGWSNYQWSIYAEQMILLMIGLGHPTAPLKKETWFEWKRTLMGIHMPLFIHQYSQVFFDFRKFTDGFSNYHQAGINATILNRNFFSRTQSYREGFWGLSAGLDPKGYGVYSPASPSSTVCIGCAVGSAMYLPSEVLDDVYAWKNGKFGARVWGQYGLVDSVDVDRNWFSDQVLGITVGPEYMSVSNLDESTSFWKDFMKVPAMQKAIGTIKN